MALSLLFFYVISCWQGFDQSLLKNINYVKGTSLELFANLSSNLKTILRDSSPHEDWEPSQSKTVRQISRRSMLQLFLSFSAKLKQD